MPGPWQDSLSRRALLVGGAAVLAGCSADDPHDGDPDAQTVTAAPVPMTGPERLASITETDFPRFDAVSLVTDEHLAERLDELDERARALATLLEETSDTDRSGSESPASTTTATVTANATSASTASSASTTQTATTTAHTATTTRAGHGGRAAQLEDVRDRARRNVSEARSYLERVRDREGEDESAGSAGGRSTNERRLDRVNHLIERLSSSRWTLRIASGRATLAELPAPGAFEDRIESVRSSLEYRCDGTGWGFLAATRIETALRECMESVQQYEEHADGDGQDGKDDASDGESARTTTPSGSGATDGRIDRHRIHRRASNYTRVSLQLQDTERFHELYVSRLESAGGCRGRFDERVEELRTAATSQYERVRPRVPKDRNRDRAAGGDGDGRSSSRTLQQAVERSFAIPKEYHEQRLAHVDELLAAGWVVLPCGHLANMLLWYRAVETALELASADAGTDRARVEVVTTAHDRAVERFHEAVEDSRNDLLARKQLGYATGMLERAEEMLTSLSAADLDTADGEERLVEVYSSLLRSHGISANARAVSRFARGS